MPDRPYQDRRTAPMSTLSERVHSRAPVVPARLVIESLESRVMMTASLPASVDAPTTIIPAGSTWKYLDNGSDQSSPWRNVSFDDSSWKSGPAQLGYGDGDEATVVGYGPDSNNKYVTTYFRRAFSITNPGSVTDLGLQLIRDDGAVVYLNGTEVYRNNMPSGVFNYNTLASSTVGGADESTWYGASIDPSLLVSGNNVVAVEIHQADVGSSDISFDFQLSADGVQLTAPSAPSQVSAWTQSTSLTNVSWTDTAVTESIFEIERSSDGVNFTQVGTAPADATNFADTTGTVAGMAYQYRVKASNSAGDSPYSTPVPALATPSHVLVVVEENEDVATIVGNTANAPYLNSLITGGAYFSDFHAITHPSQPNYIALFSGSTQGVNSDDIPLTQFSGPDLGSQLITAGNTFAGYAEDLPSVGALDETAGAIDPIGSPVYARKHNPWSDFADVPSVDNQPMTSFPTDYNQLPTLSFVIPNLMDDMHDGTVKQADTWLQTNLGAYATWANSHNSLLVVTWDEDESGDSANVIPTLVYGQAVKTGTYSETVTHFSLLRTLEDMYGVPRLGAAAGASPIQDVWMPLTPAAPSNVVATAISTTQINLTWTDNSNNETGFVVERSLNGATGWTTIATPVANTTFFNNSTGLSAGTPYFYRVRATNDAGDSLDSNVAAAFTIPTSTLNYLPTGSVWKYLDNGSNQGTAWEANGFNDSSWSSGPAQLGYGDPETTTVGYGPDPNNKYITTYFRTSFNVVNPVQASALNIQLLRDDGAVVYLNGTEVFRSNMPTGTIDYQTLASTTVGGADETTFFPGTASPSLLVAGTNVIAVEIHQSVVDSSDISFDLSLTATTPIAYLSGSKLVVPFDGTSTPLTLGTNGSAVTVTKGSTTLNFTGVTSIEADGTAAGDTLQINGSITQPLSFIGGIGNDLVHLIGGTYNFTGDLSATLHNAAVMVDAGASATFASQQHLASLTVNGTLALAAGGANTLFTSALSIGGKLDLRDNALFLDYSGSRQIGTPTAGIYNGITGLVQSGRNHGAWNGNGIITSMPAAGGASPVTTLGVAEAADVFGLAGTQTHLWNGQTVDATTILVKYTYLGDDNLDGFITGDDYFAIDAGFAAHASGYVNGDFNYSARIDADDYFAIDDHYNKGRVALSPPLPAGPALVEQSAIESAAPAPGPTVQNSLGQPSASTIPANPNPPTVFSRLNISSAYERLSESDELL